jgi:hypothetical protein
MGKARILVPWFEARGDQGRGHNGIRIEGANGVLFDIAPDWSCAEREEGL